MTLPSTVHVPFILLQLSVPPTTATAWLVVLTLALFGGTYVAVCLLVAVWVRQDAVRTDRSRPKLWASSIGASLLSGGLVRLLLLTAYLWGREPSHPSPVGE